MRDNSSKKSYFMMIGSLLIVGTLGIFRRSIPLSSSLLAFFRGSIGSIALLFFALFFKREKHDRINKKKLMGMIVNGAFLGVNWMLLFEAFNYTTIAKATLAYYMQPTIVLLLSPVVFHEKLTARKLICAGVSLMGMVLVSGIVAPSGTDNGIRGFLLGIGAACFYSLVVMINKKIEGVNTFQRTVVQLFAAAVTMLPYLLIRGEFHGSLVLDAKTVLLVLIVGVIHTGLVYVLYFGSMSRLKAQTVSMLSYIDPVTAMIVSFLFLGESLSAMSITGAILIIGSAIVSELNIKKIQ